jgi:hypothetical protein
VLVAPSQVGAASSSPSPLDFAVYATGTNCAAISIGGNTSTDSFDSSKGTYAQTKQLTGGNVGATGNVSLNGNVAVNGFIAALNTSVGTCQNGSPGISIVGKSAATGGFLQLSTIPLFTPIAVLPPGTAGATRITRNMVLPPGSYGDISVEGGTTITLSPGTYYINSISLSGKSVVTVNPAGQVILNFTGNSVSSPIDFTGGSISNPTGIPLNFQLVYGGTLPITVSGGTDSYAVLYAPKSPVSLSGGADWFGAMVVGTLDDHGGTAIHYDRSLAASPTITAAVTPAPNAAGWNNSSVTVTFTCSDPVFKITSCTAPVQVTAEGANQVVAGTAVNEAGYSSAISVTLNIDKTLPLISSGISPPRNAAGWNNSNATVSFTCSDSLSGIASCTTPILLSTEGAGQVVTGTAVDNAGNINTAAATINLDKTPPVVKAVITPAPNAAGWNNTNVNVTFTCTDGLSGIAVCPAPVQVTTEGAGQIISATATDKAGNAAPISVTVNIDKTLPVITAAAIPAPNGAGWNTSNVTVTFTCSDTGSGVSVCPSPIQVTTDGASQSISGSVTDKAGNTATASVIINLDKTAPAIGAAVTPTPNAAGWNNSTVTVSFSCSDTTSGVDVCPAPANLSTEGVGQVVSGIAKDKAGNSASASATVNLDQTPPTLSITSPADGATANPGSITVMGTVTDVLSGIASVSCQGMAATLSGTNFSCVITIAAGPNTILVQTMDRAGNSATANLSIQGGGIPKILSVTPNSGPQMPSPGAPGSIFLTGHDPDFHAFYGGNNAQGAININRSAIGFITDERFNPFTAAGVHKFLYVTSNMAPPGGHVDGTNGLIQSGFVLGTDFDRADASTLAGALSQLGTKYSSLVVASDFGGILTQAELDILNVHSAAIISFLNQGGGLFAMAETAPGEGGLANTGFFNFLPFVISSTPVNLSESGISLTPFGASLGLAPTDINGNVSHNVFTSTGGLNVVDRDPAGEILTLAGRGSVSAGGIYSVSLGAQFTHWQQGLTTVSFGSGITVSTVAVSDSTHLTAQIQISSVAALGTRTITVTTGTEVVTLVDGFMVTAGAPILVTVKPNTGQQAQQNLRVDLTGQFTNWVQGVTTASFGAGITVNSLTISSATSATAVLSIDPAATLGARNVMLATNAEVVALNDGFTVLPGTPTLTNVNPNAGQPGQQNLSVSLTGQFTHWVQGTSTASFGAGITVASLTVNSATTATAVLNIDAAAATGVRTVTVTTGSEVVTLANSFAVAASTNQPPGVSAGASQTITLPFDGFEGASIDPFWTVTGPGSTSVSNAVAHSGSQSLKLTASPTFSYAAQAWHDFGLQVSGSVSVWIQGQQLCCGSAMGLQIQNDLTSWLAVLQQSGNNNCNSCFVARVNGSPEVDYTFTASPSDWHLFEISTSPSGITFKFDGATIFTHPSVTSFRIVNMAVWAGPGGTAFADDFSTSIGVASLNGTVTDDGLPAGAILSTKWNATNGPAQFFSATLQLHSRM